MMRVATFTFALWLVACATSSSVEDVRDASPPPAIDAGGSSPARALDGLRLDLPCTQDENATVCSASVPADVRAVMSGAVGALYQVRLRMRGIVEEKTIRGGTVSDGTDTFMIAGGNLGNDTYNVYTLDIDSPPQTFYFNRGTSGHDYCIPLDIEATITIAAGAHVTLSADPVDTAEIKNVDETAEPLVVASPDVPPYPNAFNGQFLQINVLDATALPPNTIAPARSDALVFDGQDARRTITTKDWAPNFVKNECGTQQALVGLSADPKSASLHATLCTADVPTSFTRGACHAVTFDSSGGATCSAAEFAAGVSGSKGGPESVLCCSGLPNPQSACATLPLSSSDAREAPITSGDWDPNNTKLECGPHRFIAGVTRSTSTALLASITCCDE